VETTVSTKQSSKRWGIVPFEKSVAAHPILSKEYSPENERPAEQVYAGTGKRLKWICSQCGYKWEADGNNRLSGCGCPACAHKVATPTYNLAACRPDLAQEFSSRNLPLTAKDMIPTSHKRVWWDCSKPFCGYPWKTSVKNRVRISSGCPACAGKVATPQNNLTVTHPHLAEHYSGKNKLPAKKVIAGTHHLLWWDCPDCKEEFQATGTSRVIANHAFCPKCAKSQRKKRSTPVDARISFASLFPDLAKQYSPNNPQPADQLFLKPGDDPIISWQCQNTDYGHEWQARLSSRISNDIGCPECHFKKTGQVGVVKYHFPK